MIDFIAFKKIEPLKRMWMSITQKIHGSNAQINITKQPYDLWQVQAGSRTRWLSHDDDNHGFAKWVNANQVELIRLLGAGRHYGEWCGKGINAGEGLTDKMFVLFDWRRWHKQYPDTKPYFPGTKLLMRTVPVLHTGVFDLAEIDIVMDALKLHGSRLTPPGWYMKPEGIVIEVDGRLYKKVFEDEEVSWKRPAITAKVYEQMDINYLLQPKRLEKLLSRDERYLREYPKSLSDICKDYCADLEAEFQFQGQILMDDAKYAAERKALGKQVFAFVKAHINV